MTVEDSPVGPGRVTWAQLAEVIAAGLTPELPRPGRRCRRRRPRPAPVGPPAWAGAAPRTWAAPPTQMINRRAVVVEVIEAGLAALGVYEQASFDDLGGVA